MSILGRLRSLLSTGHGPTTAVKASPGSAPAPAREPSLSPAEAERIRTQNVREWTERLEREGNRTGNRRLLQQARNIRQRLNVP